MNWLRIHRPATLIQVSLLLLLALLGFFLLLPPTIPLWYSLVRLEDQMAPKMFVFIFPILGLVFLLVDRLFFKPLRQYEAAARILALATEASIVFLLISLIRMIVLLT
ncbi:MAG TPA: hypothetical protein VJ246_03480 [Patescibacteria group bacterium]|nr:hypothetical protein [Patescibacteria group bacterium]